MMFTVLKKILLIANVDSAGYDLAQFNQSVTHEYDERLVWSDEAAMIMKAEMKASMIPLFNIQIGKGKIAWKK